MCKGQGLSLRVSFAPHVKNLPKLVEKLKRPFNNKQGVCVCHNIVALPFTLKCILRQKEELWKFKYFTMQKTKKKSKKSSKKNHLKKKTKPFQCRTWCCIQIHSNKQNLEQKEKVWAKKQNVAVLFVLQTLLLKDSLAHI